MKKFMICLLALSLVGCSKDSKNDDPQPMQPQELVPKHIVREYTVPNGANSYVTKISETVYEWVNNKPVSITYKTYPKEDKNNLESEAQQVFTFENNLLMSSLYTNLRNNNKTKSTYTYQNGKLVEVIEEQNYQNQVLKTTTSYRYNGDKLIEKQEKVDDELTITTYNYVSETQIIEEKTSYATGNTVASPKQTILHTLDGQKRVIKSIQEDSSFKEISEYKYDDKKNYNVSSSFKNPESFIKPYLMKNNIVYERYVREAKNMASYNYTYLSLYEYQYNDQGYPISFTQESTEYNGNPRVSTTKITY